MNYFYRQILDGVTSYIVSSDRLHIESLPEITEDQYLAATAPVKPAPTLDERREVVWMAIKSRRDHLKCSGVKVGANWFHSDSDSRIQQLGLVIMGAAIPAGLKWKTLDNSLVDMTPTLAGQIFGAMAAWDGNVFGIAEAHRAALNATDEPELYDWKIGWPLGYGE